MAAGSSPTTQNAALERYLARQRTQRILPHVLGKRVLDFGCGAQAWNANQIRRHCQEVVGVEPNLSSHRRVGAVDVYPSLADLPPDNFDVIVALAVFEHIDPCSLVSVLEALASFCTPDSVLLGTVPTPRARPILEFLSFRLNLIDPSQIADHKVYYDDLWLAIVVGQTRWRLASYRRFQLGCNSEFMLRLPSASPA